MVEISVDFGVLRIVLTRDVEPNRSAHTGRLEQLATGGSSGLPPNSALAAISPLPSTTNGTGGTPTRHARDGGPPLNRHLPA